MVGKDQEMIFFIGQCNELQVVSASSEESHHGKVWFGVDIDGGDVMSMQSKMISFLNNGIFEEEEWLKSSKPGFGNQFWGHTIEKHSGIFLFDAQVESLFVGKYSSILG